MTKEIKNYIEEVQEAVYEEFLCFKEKELKKTKEEIFKDCYKINFYEELLNFFDCGDLCLDELSFKCLSKEKGHILSNLYNFYLKDEYASINDYDNIADFIIYYNKKYHSKTLKER